MRYKVGYMLGFATHSNLFNLIFFVTNFVVNYQLMFHLGLSPVLH